MKKYDAPTIFFEFIPSTDTAASSGKCLVCTVDASVKGYSMFYEWVVGNTTYICGFDDEGCRDNIFE